VSFELCESIVKNESTPVLRLTPTLQPPQIQSCVTLGLIFLGGGFPNPFAEVTRPLKGWTGG
jgi:hypothetical protein